MFTILTKSNKVWKRFRKSGTVFFLSMIILFTGFDEATCQNKPLLKDETLLSQVSWEQKVSEEELMSINFTQVTLERALEILAERLNVGFSYNPKVMPNKLVSFEMSNAQAHEIIYKLLEGTNLEPMLSSSKDVIILRMKESIMEADVIQDTVTGTVIDAQTGESLPGVNVIVAGSETITGSIIGTTTDMDGFYEIRVPDDEVGRVMAYLERENLLDNTIVIYAGDQGFFLGEIGWFDKRWIYDVSMRIPLIVHWPEGIEPGSVNEHLVQNLDLAPTILELAGADVPDRMQGRSMVPLLRGENPSDWRDAVYYHYYDGPPRVHRVARHYGIRTDQYTLAHFPDHNEWELFDLAADPDQLTSVYDDPDYVQIQQHLKDKIIELQEQYGDESWDE